MCGIVGYMGGLQSLYGDESRQIIGAMTSRLARRGPDADGYWIDSERTIALGHRRLAVVDLSATGAQPMISASGRYIIVLNGEIYNHQKIRKELPTSWRGTSDTETLLAAIDEWGLRKCLDRVEGMFALALWDREERVLRLARDRFGEKPLYFGWQQSRTGREIFFFSSELSALRAHPDFQATISRDALRDFMQFGNVPGRASIYTGIHKLQPGCIVNVGLKRQESISECYWSPLSIALAARNIASTFSADSAANKLEEHLANAVAQQLVADVPVGVFLSGGVDSSTVAAVAQTQSSTPVRTFTIGFDERGYDEAIYARAVSRHLGTEHTELKLSVAEAIKVIPDMGWIYSEPFADSSQIATYLLSRMAREHVVVALSGDGGDELFGGYNRHIVANGVWRRLGAFPLAIRRLFANWIYRVPATWWDFVGRESSKFGFSTLGSQRLGEKMQKVARMIASDSVEGLYNGLVTHTEDPTSLVIGSQSTDDSRIPAWEDLTSLSPAEQMMIVDTVRYLNDDVLTKVDRAAMANSLETRVPFLDQRVFEFAWSLPLGLKIDNGRSKSILRKVLYRHVPRELIDRPKSGFTVPIGVWLRGSLRDWAEGLLEPARLARDGFLRTEQISKLWNEHLSGRRDWHAPLWNVLMFQAWLDASRSDVAPTLLPGQLN